MHKKIIIGTTTLLFATIIMLSIYLITTLDPIRPKKDVFEFQINEILPIDPNVYFNANEEVLNNIILDLSQVDTTTTGLYLVNASYKGRTYQFEVMIVDLAPPVINLITTTQTVLVGDKVDVNNLVTSSDDSNHSVYFSRIENTNTRSFINPEELGSIYEIAFLDAAPYDVYVQAIDEFDNISPVVRIRIHVIKDNEEPNFFGIETLVLNKGDIFDPLKGVSAKDNIDGDLTDRIKYSGKVDTSLVGIYYILYEVSDSQGNVAIKRRRVVVSNLLVSGNDDIQDLDAGGFMTQSEFTEMMRLIYKIHEDALIYEGDEAKVIKYAHNYLFQNVTDIRFDASIVGRSYDVIVKKEIVNRVASAKALKMILDYVGIESYIVYGSGFSLNWAWNMVLIDGEYYHIDLYMNVLNDNEGEIFLLSDETMSSKGYSWNRDRYPVAKRDY